MKRLFENLAIALVIFAACFVTGAAFVAETGCAAKQPVDVATAPPPANETDFHKALRATAGITASLNAVQDVSETLYADGKISRDETRAIAQLVKQATYVNDQAVAKIYALGDVNAGNRQQVIAWLGGVVDSVKALNDQGVTHIKNPESQQRLKTALAIADGAMVLAQSFN